MTTRWVLAMVVLVACGAEPALAQGQARPERQAAPRTSGVAGRPRDVLRQAVTSLDEAAHARQRRKATSRFDPIFIKYARRYFGPAADWQRFKAQGMAESDLTPTARSRVGARGIMQLMPSTYKGIQSVRREFGRIDDPEWNIAAGIMHDRYLWGLWDRRVNDGDRWDFTFASYNAGQGTIARARRAAAAARLDSTSWRAVEYVAPNVGRWRYNETLEYVRKIRANHAAVVRER
jgi:membrane-bound lytic murein transglycosylase MltF